MASWEKGGGQNREASLCDGRRSFWLTYSWVGWAGEVQVSVNGD